MSSPRDCHIEKELPHQARADDAEDGEVDVEVNQLGSQDLRVWGLGLRA